MGSSANIIVNREISCDAFLVHGNIDAQAEDLLRSVPEQVTQPQVRFDFSQAGRINSMGIALLLRCFKSIREFRQAEITISGLNPMNTMLFKMTGVFQLAKPSQ
jgi:anti-anti-sigma regulatory factor